jgi:outer membrane lipase/esterase
VKIKQIALTVGNSYMSIALFCLLVGYPLHVLAEEFNQIYIFGDSLSDSGNLFRLTGGTIPFSPVYLPGRATNGQVWVENLSQSLGIETNSVHNFAIGGATSGSQNILQGFPGLDFQLNNFILTSGKATANDLFVVWAGTNDYGVYGIDTNTLVPNLARGINVFTEKGARNIVVVNLFDLGQAPGAQGSVELTNATNNHNRSLNVALGEIARTNPNLNIIPLDVNALFHEIIAEPSRYGFVNVTDGYLTEAASGIGFTPDQYLFIDVIHPTARGHQLIADYAIAVLKSPQAVIPQGEIALSIANKQSQAIDSRLSVLQQLSSSRKINTWDVFLSGNINFNEINSSRDSPGFKSTASSVLIGADYRLRENLTAGMAISSTENASKLHQNQGNISTDGNAVSIYSNYSQNNYYLSGATTYGSHNFDIQRAIAFDNRVAKASTNSKQFSANLNSGYIVKSGDIAYGANIGLDYDRTNIDGYTETGAGSLNLKVNGQQSESWILSLGVQSSATVKTNIGTFTPYIRGSYEYQLADTERTITTELLTQPGIPIRTTTQTSDRDRFKLNLGTQWQLSPDLFGIISYETAIGKDDHKYQTILGEIFYRF